MKKAYKVFRKVSGKLRSFSPADILLDGEIFSGSLYYIPGEETKAIEGSVGILVFTELKNAVRFKKTFSGDDRGFPIWRVRCSSPKKCNELYYSGNVAKKSYLSYFTPPKGTRAAKSIVPIEEVPAKKRGGEQIAHI